MGFMDIENKGIIKTLLKISLPLIATNLLQSIYSITDIYFIGKLGAEAASAPSIVMNVIGFLTVFAISFSQAGSTIIARASSDDKNKKRIKFISSQIFGFNILSGLLILIFCLIFARNIFNAISVPEGKTMENTIAYFNISIIGLPLFFILMSLRASLAGIGNTTTVLKIQVVTIFINIILDPIFIFTFNMGIQGAAWATNISRLVAASLAFRYLVIGKDGIQINFKHLKPDFKTYSIIFNIGFYSAVGSSLTSVGFIFIQSFVNEFGAKTIAAFGVASKINSLATLFALSLGQATGVCASKAIGELDNIKATKIVNKSLTLGFMVIGFSMTLIYIFSPYFIKFFIDDAQVIDIGTIYQRSNAFSVFLFGLYAILSGAFTGGGATKMLMFLGIFRLWGVRIPLAYLFIKVLNKELIWLWYSMMISNIVVTVIAFILYYRGNWKKNINIEAINES